MADALAVHTSTTTGLVDLAPAAAAMPLPPAAGLSAALAALEALAQSGRRVVLPGPATADLATFDALAARFRNHGGALLGLDLIGHSAAGRATLAAAQQRAAGEPVYLRYATEQGSPDTLLWHLTAAIAFAAGVLGEPHSVYATAVRDSNGAAVHLAAMTRHPGHGVALLGAGCAPSARPAHSLYLGNRGAVESNVVAGGLVLRDDTAPTMFDRLGDDQVLVQRAWLAAARVLAEGDSAAQAHGASTARQMVAAAEAVSRSLTTGRAAPLALEGSGAHG